MFCANSSSLLTAAGHLLPCRPYALFIPLRRCGTGNCDVHPRPFSVFPRRLRGRWKQATAAFLTLLPAAFLLQLVALHARHGVVGNAGGGSLSGDAAGGGSAAMRCRPLSELGTVAAAAAVNNTIMITAGTLSLSACLHRDSARATLTLAGASSPVLT